MNEQQVEATISTSKSFEVTNATPINVAEVESIHIEKTIKILVVGNAKCGKSSVISKFVHGSFDPKYKSTIGADFIRKDLRVTTESGQSIGVRLQLWDIAGQDRFHRLTRAYFSGAKGVVIVCDLSRDGTIDAVRNWKAEVDDWIEQFTQSVKNKIKDQTNNDVEIPSIPVVLFANKSDLLQDAQDAFKTGAILERICRELNFLGWWTTSAKADMGIREGFSALILQIFQNDEIIEALCQGKNLFSSQGFRLHHRPLPAFPDDSKLDDLTTGYSSGTMGGSGDLDQFESRYGGDSCCY